jgi:hypothetical protein
MSQETPESKAGPGVVVEEAVAGCLALAATWLNWDGKPRLSDDGERIYTPHKAVRRIADHLIDHLAETEAVLAGVATQPDRWHQRRHTGLGLGAVHRARPRRGGTTAVASRAHLLPAPCGCGRR